MDLIPIDEAVDLSGVAKRTLKLWLQRGRLTRWPLQVVEYRGVRRERTMIDRGELVREVARTNPRYLGSRTRLSATETITQPNS